MPGRTGVTPEQIKQFEPIEPKPIKDTVNQLPNADKLTPSEKWIYQKLPGFSESSIGKALSAFADSPAGKVLNILDVGAEGIERTLGLASQYSNRNPSDDFDFRSAWNAGSLFYDVQNLPQFKRNENGAITGLTIHNDLPGSYALADARKLLQQGKSIEEVRALYYENAGALALRAQLNDTYGHIVLDPLNFIGMAFKPVEAVQARRFLALTGKLDINEIVKLEEAARAAGNLVDAEKYAEALKKVEAGAIKPMDRWDKIAVLITGGEPYKASKISKWSNLNPFALTPAARAHELLDMVATNVGEYILRPLWGGDPHDMVKALSDIKEGAVGGQWGHVLLTEQGRTVQALGSQMDGVGKALIAQWDAIETERSLMHEIWMAFGRQGDETSVIRDILKQANENPQSLIQKLSQAPLDPSLSPRLEALQKAGQLTPDALKELASHVTKDMPLTSQEFSLHMMNRIQDAAMQQAILQFGIKGRGTITRLSDAMKAWESIPFIKGNPANMVRNIINNDITMIGRGSFGLMTSKQIDEFWKVEGWIPQSFERAFGFGIDDSFDSSLAAKRLEEALSADATKIGKIAEKSKRTAQSVKLGVFDFSEYSQKAERAASRRASTNGYLEFIQKYWNNKTGFTSIGKYIPSAELDKMEAEIPGITKLLDNIAKDSGGNIKKFEKLLQSNLEANVSEVFDNAAKKLGIELNDVIPAEDLHMITQGLPDAIKSGKVPEFIGGVRAQMENHLNDLFSKNVELLPGIIAEQVKAGGPDILYKTFGRATDEFWGGHIEHSKRMLSLNDAVRDARSVKDYKSANALWEKILSDSDNHFERVWNKFDAYLKGMKQGAKEAGLNFPPEIQDAFSEMRKGWKEFFNLRNKELRDFFGAKLEGREFKKTFDVIQEELDNKYRELISKEGEAYSRIDEMMAGSISDSDTASRYLNFRDASAKLREADKNAVADFYEAVRNSPSEEQPKMWEVFWQERVARLEEMRQLENIGSAAMQGDPRASQLLGALFPETEQTGEFDILGLAREYGIATASESGAPNNKRLLNTINKYSETKFSDIKDVSEDIARQAFEARASQKGVVSQPKAFIPDADRIFPLPSPIEDGLNQLTFGRSYAALDAIGEEAGKGVTRNATIINKLSLDLKKSVTRWIENSKSEMSSFHSAAVQFASFRRDASLLNYNRRTNFDSWAGNVMPFSFWTTHSMINTAINSIDRPAMLSTYLRSRKLLETSGIKDESLPSRLRGHIRVKLPFTPDWMGDTFINPARILLPYDGFLQPWEQAASNKLSVGGKAQNTLQAMLDGGEITQQQFDNAMQEQRGTVWDLAVQRSSEGGDNYNAFDFVTMMSSPHAPLMWAYNALRGQPNDIGPFTPLSRTAKNVATMLGVEDWNNSPYNVEGRIRKSLGLPAFDKWDDYRTDRMLSNLAADGKYSVDDVMRAMVERSGPAYDEAVYKANQEYAGGWAGTILGILGIPIKSYPEGEQKQRLLSEQFGKAYTSYKNGDVAALTDFFNEHPEYETRLALWDKPEERLRNFLVDQIWGRYNEMPRVNQDEVRNQLGDQFQINFLDKNTRSYESLSPLQMQVWLKLMGGKPVGTLSADQELLIQFNQLKLTDPETAYRAQTFYDTRESLYPDWFDMQSEYYDLDTSRRKSYLNQNPELKQYWDYRRDWMKKNPDLVKYLTDDKKALAKAELSQRIPGVSVPTQNEIYNNLSPAAKSLIEDYQNGQDIPPELEQYLDFLAEQYGMTPETLRGIVGIQ